MMGERTVMQEALFYGFSLERHVSLPKTISGNIGGANRRGYLVRRWFRGARRVCG